MPSPSTIKDSYPLRYPVYLLLTGLGIIILLDIVQTKHGSFMLADLAIWTLPVLPLWWLLIHWKKRTRHTWLRIVLQLSISLLSFLPWVIAVWCTTHSWLVRPVEADGFGTGILLFIALSAMTLCLLAVSLLIGEVGTTSKRAPSVPAPQPQAPEDICLINIEHNRAYDHIVITLNLEGKETLECRLTRLLPQHDHEFDCPDENSMQHCSGDDYTPCVFFNLTHAPADTVYGDIEIKDDAKTLILNANRNGITRLREAVAALSEQCPETCCDAHTVPDEAEPYSSVISFRFVKDTSPSGITTPEKA